MESFFKELVDNFIGVFKKYTVVTGRASRREFWMFVLAGLILGVILSILSAVPILGKLVWIVSLVYSIAVIVPSITVGVRRLHDTNKTGWLMLLCLIPLIGGIIVLVLCAFEGTPGKNQYGSKPA